MTRPIGRSADWTITTRAAALALLAGGALALSGCASNTGARADAGASAPGAVSRDDLPPDDLAARRGRRGDPRVVRSPCGSAGRRSGIFNDSTRGDPRLLISRSRRVLFPRGERGRGVLDDERSSGVAEACERPTLDPKSAPDRWSRHARGGRRGDQPLRCSRRWRLDDRPGAFDNPIAVAWRARCSRAVALPSTRGRQSRSTFVTSSRSRAASDTRGSRRSTAACPLCPRRRTCSGSRDRAGRCWRTRVTALGCTSGRGLQRPPDARRGGQWRSGELSRGYSCHRRRAAGGDARLTSECLRGQQDLSVR